MKKNANKSALKSNNLKIICLAAERELKKKDPLCILSLIAKIERVTSHKRKLFCAEQINYFQLSCGMLSECRLKI